ncbi:putative actin family protein [Blattamonas nauphoetae]|uniref:Actin family protein n=1 Tax=Blattamonas nauphoetae TaxID=2049346 RepID=A0ABQ9Y510_9EUKA|nr:putative actin family protein [Blattamonas nauphoetae]
MEYLTLRSAFENGRVVDWSIENEIFQNLLGTEMKFNSDAIASTHLILSQPLVTPQSLSKITLQVLFETYGFPSVCLAPAPFLSCWGAVADICETNQVDSTDTHTIQQHFPECALVIDAGHASVRVTPMYQTLPVLEAEKVTRIGGRQLTNILKEIVSYRYFDVSEEFFLMNDVKEKMLFFPTESNHTWNYNNPTQESIQMDPITENITITTVLNTEFEIRERRYAGKSVAEDRTKSLTLEFVLPDFKSTFTGYTRPSQGEGKEEQVLRLDVDRVIIPDFLFNPKNIGIASGGVADAVLESLALLPVHLRPAFTNNIFLVGGTSNFAGFSETLYNALRPNIPSQHPLRIFHTSDASRTCWNGGRVFVERQPRFSSSPWSISRKEYDEMGDNIPSFPVCSLA